MTRHYADMSHEEKLGLTYQEHVEAPKYTRWAVRRAMDWFGRIMVWSRARRVGRSDAESMLRAAFAANSITIDDIDRSSGG